MTNGKIKRLLKKYTRLLRLEDWDIEFDWLPAEVADRVGETRFHTTQSKAYIKIRTGLSEREFLLTLVHELLHVRLGYTSFEENSKEDQNLEQGINRLAEVLVCQIETNCG